MKYPQVQYYHLSYLKQALAHCLRSGTLKAFFYLDRGLSTNIGLTERISTFLNPFSMDSDSEKNVLKALVAEQRVEYGAQFQPMNDDKLIIADFDFCIFCTKTDVKPAIETQLILIVSMTCYKGISSQRIISPVPTLLTRIPISKGQSSEQIFLKNSYFWEFLKSATIYLNWQFLLLIFDIEDRFSIVFFIFCQFLEIMQTFQPNQHRTSQNPNPIPSVPPVTTAHLPSFCPYFQRWRRAGISYFTICQMIANRNRQS